MRTVPYDSSRTALYRPSAAAPMLRAGPCSDELLCAEASRLVYKRFESSAMAAQEIRLMFRSLGFDQMEFFDCAGSQAFAAAHPAATLICFRGTTRSLNDIVTDLKIWPRQWPLGGRAHAGFCTAFNRLCAALDHWLIDHPGRRLLTGHSLGGALATLAASVYKPARLITFGTPRVGDGDFCAALEGVEWLRYVDCCDLVARVPPELLGFCHRGELRYIDRHGAIHSDPPVDFIKEDSRLGRSEYRREEAPRPGAVKLRDLADHAPANYIYPVSALDTFQSADRRASHGL
ncbi:MAG: lipase family protein [Deltaproteobacteria bacterium]|nr:lipase family protein [Deltaproteobacteria bacterium]